MKGAVYGTISVDSIVNECNETSEQLGGEAFYAYRALGECECDAKIITGVSRELMSAWRSWFRENGMDESALLLRTDCGIHNLIDTDGQSTSSYGKDFTKYNTFLHRVFIKQIEPYVKDIDFLYVSDMLDNTNAERLKELKERYGFSVIWQIPKVNNKSERELVLRNAGKMDALAIKAEDASILFHVNKDENIISRLREISLPVLYLDWDGNSWLINQKLCLCSSGDVLWHPHKQADRCNYLPAVAAAAMWGIMKKLNEKEILFSAVTSANRLVFPDMGQDDCVIWSISEGRRSQQVF